MSERLRLVMRILVFEGSILVVGLLVLFILGCAMFACTKDLGPGFQSTSVLVQVWTSMRVILAVITGIVVTVWIALVTWFLIAGWQDAIDF